MTRLIGCFVGHLGCSHERCVRARAGKWTCAECGGRIRSDGLCNECDDTIRALLWTAETDGAVH